MSIDKVAYERIRADTIKSDAEQKIEFLQRYVPRLRMSPRNILEELDILFVKESYTKGYRVLKEGDFNENVYFVRSGTCRVLRALTGPLSGIKAHLSQEEQGKYKYVSLYNLSKWNIKYVRLDVGQSFGEDSALNGTKSQEIIETVSDKTEAYRISKTMLLQYFGGSASEVIYAIRAGSQAKKNWVQLKLQQLANVKKEDLMKHVQFKDETEYKGLNPAKSIPGETPYLKAVQTYGRESKIQAEPMHKPKQEEEKTAASTSAKVEPMATDATPKDPPAAPPAPPKLEFKSIRPRPDLSKRTEVNEDKKYDRVMGFATNKFLASDRLKELSSQQMKGLTALRTIAQDVKGGGKQKPDPKASFKKESISKFQSTVMMADPAIVEQAKQAAKLAPNSNLFKKMQNFTMNDIGSLKAKLGQ